MAMLVGAGEVQQFFINLGNIGNATQALENMFGPYLTVAQIRTSIQNKTVYQVNGIPGAFAIYDPADTTSADDGTTMIVGVGGKRYRINTLQQLFNSPLA